MSEAGKRFKAVVALTFDQEELIRASGVFDELNMVGEGGAIMAQVYADGIRMSVLSPEDCVAVAKALGTPIRGLQKSAFQEPEAA